jgi:hypothetical protein
MLASMRSVGVNAVDACLGKEAADHANGGV